MSNTVIAGVDGCKQGWVGVWLDNSGSLAGAAFCTTLEELLQGIPNLMTAGVDMPIQLLDAPARPADTQARKALGPERGRSVFPALPRFVIEDRWLSAGFEEVNQECRQLYGRAFSRQSLHLRNKIAEVNEVSRNGFPVIEVHPELSFTAMNNSKPPGFSKKSWGGIRERISLLQSEGISLWDSALHQVQHLAADDIIDAAAAAWSAHRFSFGKAISYPPGNQPANEPKIWS